MMLNEFTWIPIKCIKPGRYQPRQQFDPNTLDELAQSIKTHGLIEPLVVRSLSDCLYEIIAGERRWRAAKLLNLEELPCIIGHYTDEQACTLALVENVQRDDLNPIEEASAYHRLINEFCYLQNEVAILIGKSRSHVANSLRLLNLNPAVKQCLITNQLSMGHGRVLAGLDANLQSFFCEQILSKYWSVRQLELAVKTHKNNSCEKPHNNKKDKDIKRLENILSEQVGTLIQFEEESGDGGWLKIKYFDNDTLAGLLDKLGLRYD